jgi:hypothetical protein
MNDVQISRFNDIAYRFKLLKKYNNKIEEIKVIKDAICNDLKRLYLSVSEASTLYYELKKRRNLKTKEQEKNLLSYLRIYLGCDNKFKFDTDNIVDHNYSRGYIIYFTYKKKKYYLQCPCTERIDASDFDNPNHWVEEFGMCLYSVDDNSGNSTLLGSALTRDSLQELVEKEILNGH